jgi:hypothetical protein
MLVVELLDVVADVSLGMELFSPEPDLAAATYDK